MRFLSVALVAFAAFAAHGQQVSILSTGSFHGEEVPDDAAGRWFAIVAGEGGASLQAVEVTVSQEFDGIVDSEGETTGRRVDIAPAIESLVLVRGIANLRVGAIPTSLIRKVVGMDAPLVAHLGDREYSFGLDCADVTVSEGQRHQECALLTSDGSLRQAIASYTAYFEGNERFWSGVGEGPLILWAGDLDADGKLDLLLDTSDHYNISEIRLYLSSRASDGALVAPVATFSATGC